MYQKSDFSKCVFNPLVKDVFKEYDRLSDLKVIISDNKDQNGIAKYIFSVYDPNSPLVRDYRDLRLRRMAGVKVAGIDNLPQEELEKIYELKDEAVVMAVDYFLKEVVYSRIWYMICANEQTFYEYGMRMLRPIENGTDIREKDYISAMSIKTKLSEDMKYLNERIEADYARMFNGDDDLESAVGKVKRLSPEEVAGA